MSWLKGRKNREVDELGIHEVENLSWWFGFVVWGFESKGSIAVGKPWPCQEMAMKE